MQLTNPGGVCIRTAAERGANKRDCHLIADEPAPAPHRAHPERCAAPRIVLVTVPRVSRSCEHFPDSFDLHLLEGANNLTGLKDFCLKNGSSQGQNLALTVIFVPNLFDSGPARQGRGLSVQERVQEKRNGLGFRITPPRQGSPLPSEE